MKGGKGMKGGGKKAMPMKKGAPMKKPKGGGGPSFVKKMEERDEEV